MNDIKHDDYANDVDSLVKEFSDDALESAACGAQVQMVATGAVFCTGLESCPADR